MLVTVFVLYYIILLYEYNNLQMKKDILLCVYSHMQVGNNIVVSSLHMVV